MMINRAWALTLVHSLHVQLITERKRVYALDSPEVVHTLVWLLLAWISATSGLVLDVRVTSSLLSQLNSRA